METIDSTVLDTAIGAARKLMPDAEEDAQAEFAARLLELLPARISLGVVQVRDNSRSTEWATVSYAHPDEVPGLNRSYGWPKYRVVEMAVCP